MRNWNLTVKPPLTFTLAADPRLGATDCFNDHIWELSLGGGEPPAVALQTTFGLRARSLRIFPRFLEDIQSISDPDEFSVPVAVQAFYPNYVRLVFEPLCDLRVIAEYWVPNSQILAGKYTIENRAEHVRQIGVDLVANLSPSEDGQRMIPLEMNAVTVLTGVTGGLQPVLFMSGGSQGEAGVYPALKVSQELASRQSKEFIWVETALPTAEESFEVARKVASCNWQAEIAHIELTQDGMVEIYTGDQKWDFTLAYAQKVAMNLLLAQNDSELPVSFVLTRLPDQGYSSRGDGSDFPILWNGPTPWDCYYLFTFLLPAFPEIAVDLLQTFFATQGENGFIDLKPGLGNQHSQVWATPLLATLTEQVYLVNQDSKFLSESFPTLLAFLQGWMSEHDRDGDGIPEWDHPIQLGYDDHPIFTRWQEWAQGVEISTTEGPDLCALLYRECQALLRMAVILGRDESITALRGFSDNLKAAVDASWDENDVCYHYWDRESHQWAKSEFLGECIGPGEVMVQRSFEKPIRLAADLRLQSDQKRKILMFIDGESVSGQQRLERVNEENFRWRMDQGHFTGQRIYNTVERIEVQEIDPEERITFNTVGLDDLTQGSLIPLWANIPDKSRCQEFVEKTITNPEIFWRPNGIRADLHQGDSNATIGMVYMHWNQMIGEGLVAYNYYDKAAELVTHLMNVSTNVLFQGGTFRRFYEPASDLGRGESNHLLGLPPVGLFLRTLGVQIYTPWKVALEGFNPFPWPVTVKYRGLTILRQEQKSSVIFPDGQMVVVDDPRPCLVTNEFAEE